MSNLLNWDNLKLYNTDQKKSFEELCFQIAIEEYGTMGTFTSIDDSGGGDGVEFYLTLKNGDIWGWQAKFFGRLNESGRKNQIKKSLQTAYKKHPNLKKWFLCNKSSFTNEEKKWFETKLESDINSGERVLPENHEVELLHWGESDFLNFTRKYTGINNYFFSEKLFIKEWFRAKYDIYAKTSQIINKYESKLHIQTEIDDRIVKILGGKPLSYLLDREMNNQQVLIYAKDYNDAILRLNSEEVDEEYRNIQLVFLDLIKDKLDVIDIGINKLEEIKELLKNGNESFLNIKINEFELYLRDLHSFCDEYEKLTDSELCEKLKHLRESRNDNEDNELEKKNHKKWIEKWNYICNFKKKKTSAVKPVLNDEIEKIKDENKKRGKARNILFGPLYSLHEYAMSSLELSFRALEMFGQNELHISGEAGMGKTHVSFNLYKDRIINQKLPAIFIFANDLKSQESLEKQIKDIIGLDNYDFDDFLSALEICAKTYGTKIPIIIDGLNESSNWKTIWSGRLERLILKIKQKYKHLVVITTYRTSYENALFPKNYFDYKTKKDSWKIHAIAPGFEGLTLEAIKGYFDYYKITLNNHSDAIGEFKNPLYLKIFCETKNQSREKSVVVSFQNEDLFEVFDEYIKNSNENIVSCLQILDPKYDKTFVEDKLLKLSEYIWKNNSRGIPRSEKLFDNEELKIFEGENLLLYRDWNQSANKEEIQFTYDLLAGYIVSKYLIQEFTDTKKELHSNIYLYPLRSIKTLLKPVVSYKQYFNKKNLKDSNSSLLRFVKSKNFETKLLYDKNKHPLFNDILRTISILLIKEAEIFLFDVLANERAIKYSTESLFEINAKYIKKNDVTIDKFLKKIFSNTKDKYYLFNLFKNSELDINNPLNFGYLSNLLKDLSMSDRDISWSEYIRKNHSWYSNSYFTNFVVDFENACKEGRGLPNRIHIAAKKIMWILTTNIRRLRDEATKSLYFYARKYPKEFLELLKLSLNINDPYVSERMLAATYGLAMARENSISDDVFINSYLPEYAKFIYDSIFKEDATFLTTHILARDYAKRVIDISLIYYPDLFTKEQITNTVYPLSQYTHKTWGVSDDSDGGVYRDGNAPIQMDFKNYTIGRLIKGRGNYEDQHPEYKKVLSNIYWRIYNLGYSLKKFGEIDKQIASSNWNYSSQDNKGQVDRYGKKYSWIAFYEMAGLRSDMGLLKGWDNEDDVRISDIDIDPSFPVELKEINLIERLGKDSFIGDLSRLANEWYENDADLDINKYLKIQGIFDEQEDSEWILLRGNISQKDANDQKRDVYIAISAVFLDDKCLYKIKDVINRFQDYQFELISNNEDYYIFNGEIPWSDLMPLNGVDKLQVNYNYRKIKKTKNELQIFNNGKKLSEVEQLEFDNKVTQIKKDNLDSIIDVIKTSKIDDAEKLESCPVNIFDFLKLSEDEEKKEVAYKMGYKPSVVEIEYESEVKDSLDIDIEKSVFESSWESYHSEIISSSETIVPSKEISSYLNLFLKPQTSDMYDKNSKIVSSSFKFGKEYNDKSVFVYIRKEYLEKYLKHVNKKVLWFQWSEKRYFANGIKKTVHGDSEREFRNFNKIYKM